MSRIIICGLNGTGKSTLGRSLAHKLGCRFVDVEELYFPKSYGDYIYEHPRTEQEVSDQLLTILQNEDDLIFSSVTGKYVSEIDRYFQCCVILEVNKNVRMERVRSRSYEKFGNRMLRGGDLYEKEEAFFSMVNGRDDGLVNSWVATLKIPIIRLDGENTIFGNVEIIETQIRRIQNYEVSL